MLYYILLSETLYGSEVHEVCQKKEKRLKGKITENPPELSQTIKESRWK